MKNWKMETRIAAGFTAVIANAVALGAFAYARMTSIENSSTQVVGSAVPGLKPGAHTPAATRGLAQMNRLVGSSGKTIELETHSGDSDVRDREFIQWES